MMSWKSHFVQQMKAELSRRQSQNPKYSMRKFAKDLGISAGGLSNILNERFEMSIKRAADVLSGLRLPPGEDEKLRAQMGLRVERRTIEISPQNASVLTNWIHCAVLHFFDLDVPDKSVPVIATRLALPTKIVQGILEELLANGFLRTKENGEIYKPEVHWQGGDGGAISPEIIRSHHRDSLQIAARSIDGIPTEHRDLSSITFCGHPDQLALAREEIRNLHQRISAVMESESRKTEVYRLSVALFPLTVERPTP